MSISTWFGRLLGLTVVFLQAQVHGEIITTGAIVVVPPPPSVMDHVTESDTNILLFQEQESLTLSEDIVVDMTDPGTVTHRNETPGGTVLSGTTVDVYLVHFDSVGNVLDNFLTLTGSATFDTEIIGVMLELYKLDATDAMLGVPTTSYPTGTWGRGSGEWKDSITIEADRRTLSLSISTDTHVDQVRVITAPEPCTPLAILSMGILGLLHYVRRRFAAS